MLFDEFHIESAFARNHPHQIFLVAGYPKISGNKLRDLAISTADLTADSNYTISHEGSSFHKALTMLGCNTRSNMIIPAYLSRRYPMIAAFTLCLSFSSHALSLG